MATKEFTREEIIRIARDITTGGKDVTRDALKQEGISERTFLKYFPEGYDPFKETYGFKIDRRSKRYTEDELLTAIDEFITKFKRKPTWFQLVLKTHITAKVWKKHFGKIPEILTRYRKWLKRHNPKSRNMKAVDAWLVKIKETASRTPERETRRISGKGDGPVLNFLRMVYPPDSEQGVVILFGMMCECLDLWIEKVQEAYPDCVATRWIRGRRKQVRIEFENKSGQYPIDHARDHREKGCDILVCWEHNWKNVYPGLEVIELKSEIEKFKDKPEFRP